MHAQSMWRGVLVFPLVLFACTSELPKLEVGRIILNAPRAFDGRSGEKKILREHIESAMQKEGSIDWRPGRNAEYRLALRLDGSSRDDWYLGVTLGPMRLSDEGKLPGYDSVVLMKSYLSKALEPQSDAPPDLGKFGIPAFTKAWDILTKMRLLATRDDAAVLAALGSHLPLVADGTDESKVEQQQMLSFIMEECGRRKLVEAVTPLIGLISNADTQPALLLRAVGALVAIGDVRAVKALAEITVRKNPAFVLQIVFAVSAIGGRAAEGFLVTLAGGHPNPQIQAGAKQALEEMQRRFQQGSAPKP